MSEIIIEESVDIYKPATLENWESHLFVSMTTIQGFMVARKIMKEVLKDLNVE